MYVASESEARSGDDLAALDTAAQNSSVCSRFPKVLAGSASLPSRSQRVPKCRHANAVSFRRQSKREQWYTNNNSLSELGRWQ